MTPGPRETPCVLLAEEGWGSTLQAIRSLGRVGVPVLVATAGRGSSIYRRSRWCTAARDLDPSDPLAFCAEVRAWLDAQVPADVQVPVVPLSDRLVAHLDAGRDVFGGRAVLSIPPSPLAQRLLDRSSSLDLAAEVGLDLPEWVRVDDVEDLAAIDALAPPIALRSVAWRGSGPGHFGTVRAATVADARAFAHDAVARGATVIAQRYLDVPDDAVEFAITWSSKGHRPAICTGRKRRQSSTDGGVMVWGEAEPLPDVRRAAVEYLDGTGYEGLGGLEFIRADGRLWFVEFNPRLEAIHFLAAKAGIDTVVMEYDRLTGASVAAPVEQQAATAWVGSAAYERMAANRTEWRTIVGDRVAFARSPRRTRAVVSAADPLPALALAGRLARHVVTSRRRDRAGA